MQSNIDVNQPWRLSAEPLWGKLRGLWGLARFGCSKLACKILREKFSIGSVDFALPPGLFELNLALLVDAEALVVPDGEACCSTDPTSKCIDV